MDQQLDSAWWEPLALIRQEVATEAKDEAWALLEVERSRTRLVDRITPGARLTLRSGSCLIVGSLADVLVDAIVIDVSGRHHLVPAAAVRTAVGLATRLAPDSPQRRTPMSWLRAQVGEPGLVHLVDGDCLRGEIAGVGADHIDLLLGDGLVSVAYAAIDFLSVRG